MNHATRRARAFGPFVGISIAIAVVVLALSAGGCARGPRDAAPAAAAAPAWNGPAEPRLSNVFQSGLDPRFTPDRDVIVTLVELPPGAALDRHWHPGEEFHYYLEGDVTIEIEGRPAYAGRPGTVGHVPLRALHTATAGDRGARILVFRVHDAGQPVRFSPDQPRPE